jgi:steroid 5-alpha reductase family enzyme
MDTIMQWLSQQAVSLTPLSVLLFGLALLISAIGFYRTVYFISVGYAFSIVGMALAVVIAFRNTLNWVVVLQNVLLLAWGLRLGIYILQRDLKPAYVAQRDRTEQSVRSVTRPIQAMIWISVSLLYVSMFSPSLFHAAAPEAAPSAVAEIVQIVGVVVMLGGFAIESLADKQKSDFKHDHPQDFCDLGLYRLVRCPNYLGEILFWLGNWIVGAACYTSFAQWAVSLTGLVCIILIMMGSTKRLERSQLERYGSRPAFQKYIKSVPVLVPFVPIYTLKNVKVYLE